jgi:quinol monooxygenase YgiN
LKRVCRSYALYRDKADVCCFVFIETWADQAAFSDHEKTSHFLALVEALPPHVTTDGRVMVLDPVA